MPEQKDQPKASRGVSRRELLKRGAIAGGVLWAAPVIQTIAAPDAMAQVSLGQGACCECKAPRPPLNLTCSVDDPSCMDCINIICNGQDNFSRYFVGDGCGCTNQAPKKCIPGTRCVQKACP